MKKFELVAEMSKCINKKIDFLEYDESLPSCLRWKYSPSANVPAGSPAFSSVSSNGYFIGTICNKKIFAHRVVWRVRTGEWPSGVIDHIDRDRLNNKIHNLRDVSHSENNRNKEVKGFTIDRRTGKYIAMIKVDGKNYRLGSFASKDEASSAYICAKNNLPEIPRKSSCGDTK